MIVTREMDDVTIYAGQPEPIANFPLSGTQPTLPALAVGKGWGDSIGLVEELTRILVARPMPPLMSEEARSTASRPTPRFENFIGWYWYQSGNGKFTSSMVGLLIDVWPEFDYLQLLSFGHGRALRAVFKQPTAVNGEFELEFQQFSEGERMLIVFYTLVAYQLANPPTTIIIDEPDNFVGLPELQPWLLRMLDDRPDDGQVIIVSHNPQIIQTMGYELGSYFERSDHLSPTRVCGLSPNKSGLTLSERLARGWLDE